ncbi:signal recognition particle-docking protein FtsY [Candidatus Bathyarchaeota archaeon]|nr:signal recognition particle-docking protein FtsY [Candidatus Bathyarchaeota archaeon]
MFEKLKSGFKTFVTKIKTKELNEENLAEPLEELKISLVKNDVAYFVADKIGDLVKEKLLGSRITRGSKVDTFLKGVIRDTIKEILDESRPFDILERVREKAEDDEPYIMVFLGVNGTGKTTTIAKLANYFKKNKISSVIAASDTFRAGSIEQLEKHARKVGVRVIKHEYKSDPSSVAWDAIAHAQARHVRVVLVDTAGRQVMDTNLMREMKKIVDVTEPDLVVYVGDALAGNDVVTQVQKFSDYVPINASILTKIDADASGGGALSVSFITKKPIIFVGTGQGYNDIAPFNVEWFLKKIVDF